MHYGFPQGQNLIKCFFKIKYWVCHPKIYCIRGKKAKGFQWILKIYKNMGLYTWKGKFSIKKFDADFQSEIINISAILNPIFKILFLSWSLTHRCSSNKNSCMLCISPAFGCFVQWISIWNQEKNLKYFEKPVFFQAKSTANWWKTLKKNKNELKKDNF